ncbi:MAG: hypothetical protein JO328_21890 [Hyphomicrobiales bacterium]|nr:hypothetical protein [Hyphomicrobiales bacterium]
MRHTKPPSPSLYSKTSLFLIGRDRAGHWVVRDLQGLRGGLFVGRAAALKYALFENGNRPQAVVMVPGVLEFDLRAEPQPDAPELAA